MKMKIVNKKLKKKSERENNEREKRNKCNLIYINKRELRKCERKENK